MPYKDHEKQKEFQRKWVKARRKKHMGGKKCARCGAAVGTGGELDHKKPHGNTEKIDHRLWSLKDSKRKKKLKGMQVLCKSCHKKKTKKDIKNMKEDLSFELFETDDLTLDYLRELIRKNIPSK